MSINCHQFFSSPEPKARDELIGLDSSRRSSVRPCVHTFKHEYLWDQLTDRYQISSKASLGWGIGCFIFFGQIGSELWFPWQQIAPIGLYWRKPCDHSSSFVLNWFFFILAGNEDIHNISDGFEIRQDQTRDFGVSCLWASEKSNE